MIAGGWNEWMRTGDADVRAFAADLQLLRMSAGIRSLRAVARQAHYSHTSIAEAVAGRSLPSLELTLAFVAACHGDVEEWRRRWSYAAGSRHPDV